MNIFYLLFISFLCSIFLSFLLLSIWNWTGNERNIFTGNDSFTKILVIAHQAQRHALNYFHECLTSYAIYSSSVVSSLCHDDCQYKALLFLIMTRTLDVGDSFLSKECSCIIIIYNLAFRIFLFLFLSFFFHNKLNSFFCLKLFWKHWKNVKCIWNKLKVFLKNNNVLFLFFLFVVNFLINQIFFK